ncbi:putative glycerol-3-phosphate acyltransferase [Tepidimonas alkaliphilus]|uniref:Glycerol-3-phosphate acyltransferase n=1 Tax=Tepidimonas alkaliphilus TaxID=2588942 RepID=A0A554WCZ8_9BURK|nr:glycerol-3-phosphate 1-O-acyltransferase PlsY [Tepidimonas alkaliphilus]TSE21435.1 putative glycerol-3-phosphate acyltransferase [Tepidimonas alkaliphilus]
MLATAPADPVRGGRPRTAQAALAQSALQEELPVPESTPWVAAAVAALLAYLVGSLSFAVLVSRVMGLADPRTYGSGNPGATNVLRSGSKAAALLTLLLDGLKGWAPVWASARWGSNWGLADGALACVGLAAFLGHLFPVWFRFRGGKGVATAAGVMLAWVPPLGLLVVFTWVAVALTLRYSSLAAIVAALAAPLGYGWLDGLWWEARLPIAAAMVAMVALLLWRHAGNIQRLLAGQESRIGERSRAAKSSPPQRPG